MFSLKHNSVDIVSQVKDIETSIWQFFLDVMPTPELSQYLLDLCSYAISGIRDQHFFIIFEGVGGNGKTLFFHLLEAMLGDYMVNVDVKLIMGKNKSGVNCASPELHRCMGKLVAATQEPESTELLNTSICKSIGSGDKMSARKLYTNPVEFYFSALLIINCNNRPGFMDFGKGITRRLLLLLWRYSFVDNPTKPHEQKCDNNMITLFKSQSYGAVLLRMAIVNLRKLVSEVDAGKRAHIIVHPASVVKDTQTYGMQNDPMKMFWDCCIRPDENSVLKMHEIWEEFEKYRKAYFKHDVVFEGFKEAQLPAWLRTNIGNPEKKSKGRNKGVTGYWHIRFATCFEEEEYRLQQCYENVDEEPLQKKYKAPMNDDVSSENGGSRFAPLSRRWMDPLDGSKSSGADVVGPSSRLPEEDEDYNDDSNPLDHNVWE